MAVMTLGCVLGTLAGRRWAIVGFPLLLSIHIRIFVPVLAQNAQIAGVVILWNLLPVVAVAAMAAVLVIFLPWATHSSSLEKVAFEAVSALATVGFPTLRV